MSLSIGAFGATVRSLQERLNGLGPTALEPLAVDGKFGPKTRARVREFQQGRHLIPDSVVGPLTLKAIQLALSILGQSAPASKPASAVVWPITQPYLGGSSADHLVIRPLPPIPYILESTFHAGSANNQFSYLTTAISAGRVGIFGAKKGNRQRAVILLLPASGIPNRVMICIPQQFAQSAEKVEGLGWEDPLSKDLIEFALLKHVLNRWGTQTLTSKKPMAFLYVVRAKGKELGPFANDGAFMRQTLTEIAALTQGAFSFESGEAMTFSNGISEFNVFLNAISAHLNVMAVYNIDPNPAIAAVRPTGAISKQYLSGTTGGGGSRPGFEFAPDVALEQ